MHGRDLSIPDMVTLILAEEAGFIMGNLQEDESGHLLIMISDCPDK
jgi:hypothetical protein